MPTPLTTAVRRLRTLAAPATADLPDRDLVARFRASADEAAFAALVARHGPAVLGVCRRVLSDPHAAEDAFQATFLTLARRAGGVRNPSAVGCWLHGVAFRVASKLRGRLARLPRTGDVPEVPTPGDDVSWREVRRVLDEEVTRLPDRLRLPVLLCYFEGKTRDEAADALGCKVTTLRGRLEDGRERLRTRLARRGVELSAALLAVSTAAAAPAVDEALTRSTVTAAMSAAGGVVPTAARLALLAVLALGLGSTLILSPGQGKQAPAPETPKADPPPKAADPPKPPEWGDPAGDFRLRLRNPAPVKVGDGPELVTDLKFAGKGGRFIPRSPEMLEVEVNGLWYRVPGGFTTEAETLVPDTELTPWLTARLTTAWVHLRDRPGADADAPQEAVPFRLAPGKHTVRVAYRFGRTDRAVSNAVTLEVLPDGWGEATEGIKARLRLAKTRFRPGEPLKFEFDLKNVGRAARTFNPIPFACVVELNGEKYRHQGEVDYKFVPKEIPAGGEAVPFVTVTADDGWRAVRIRHDETWREIPADVIRLKLTPGKHVVRVRFPVGDKGEVVSQAVPIVVEAPPLDPKLAALARSADRIWVVPSPTRDKPVPAPVRVLKGPPGRPEVFDLRLLPADDPKKQWIVFLQAQEEDVGVPAVKLLAEPTWSIPFDEDTAAGIAEALLPATWGETAGGLQMGLRFRDPGVAPGSPIIVEVVIRNPGPEDQTLEQHRMSIYDYWPGTTFQVTAPGGGTWTLRRPVEQMDEADRPLNVTLKSGEAYVHAVRLDRWQAVWAGEQSKPVPPRKDLFSTPGEYSVAGLYVQAKSRIRAWAGSLASKPVNLTVTGPKAEWGPPVEGIQARVRVTNAKPVVGDPLTFELDLRNRGTKDFVEAPIPFFCQIELDGREYKYQLPIGYPTGNLTIKPGGQVDGWTKVTATDGWAHVGNPAGSGPKPPPQIIPLALTPGKHTLCVSYQMTGANKIKVVSQTAEFVVGRPEWGPAAEGIRARVRLAKATLREGEPLAFALDLKNEGTKDLDEGSIPFRCEITLDGRPFTYRGPIDSKAKEQIVKAGGQSDGWTSVTTDQFWIRSFAGTEALADVLTPGKHLLRVAYQMMPPNKMNVVSQEVEFDVEPVLVPAADRIVVATFDGRDTMGLKPVKTLKGPHNTWQPDVQRVTIPEGSNTLPGDGWDREWLVFLRADEDGREVPKLAAGAVDWLRPATPAAIQAVKNLLGPPAVTGAAVNGLSLGLRPSGDGVRFEVVLTNRGKEPVRVLQHRFNVYDYWPFLTFTVTGPDGKTVTLSKPAAAFKREDYVGEQVLEPGESYVHAVRLDQWPDPRKMSEDLGPLFGTGRYMVKATYAVPGGFRNRHPKIALDDNVHWAGEVVSNELTVELGLSGRERLADFKANADRLHLTLTRRPRPGAAEPAGRPLRYVHLHVRHIEREPHATYPDGKPVGADERIIDGEAEKLLAFLAAAGFFDRAAPQAAETTEGDFLLEVWHEGASRGRLRLAYPWTEDTVRQLTKLAGCLFGGHPDLVKDVLSPVADTVPPWGEAVEGVACRARNVRAEGRAILLDLDVWNRGKETWGLTADASFADLEVDGVWYVPRYDRPIDVLSMIFKPGRRTDRPIPISTATGWKEKDPPRGREPKLLAVEPGKHRVRAAFEVSRAGKTLRVVSNLAEVEVPK
jgi:RNA polymerase sigma factor (sigma-70 family)